MPKISLNSFIDYFVAQTFSKPAKVRAAKAMMLAPPAKYAATDYWLPLRKAVEASFAAGGSKAQLDAAIAAITDSKKIQNYTACATALKKWFGNKSITASSCAAKTWKSGSLEVKVTPELIATINGTTYVLKLWFKAEPLSKLAANPMLRLIELTHGTLGSPALLDIRRGKLITGAVPKPADMDLVLASEALAYADLWTKV